MGGISPNCKYCGSSNLIKYGKYKETQYYLCNNCKHKFSSYRTIPKMHYPTSKIAQALHSYYEGMSLNEIRRNFIEQYNNYISDVTVWNWVNRFSRLAIIMASNCRPKVSNLWIAYETKTRIGRKEIWLWDILDTKTLFLLASHLSPERTKRDIRHLFQLACERADKTPTVIYTDKLTTYFRQIKGARVLDDSKAGNFDTENDVSVIKRFRWAIDDRAKAVRGLHSVTSAKLLMDGWFVHYNFFKPRTSLRNRTPASVAGVMPRLGSWKEVCEQPFEFTARIPIKTTV